MQFTLWVSVVVILIHVQIGSARELPDDDSVIIVPSRLWSFINSFGENNTNEFIKERKSTVKYNPSRNLKKTKATTRSKNQNNDQEVISRSSFSATTRQPKEKTEAKLRLNDLKPENPDLSRVAYKTARYLRLITAMVYEHIKCVYEIFQIMGRFMYKKLVLLLKDPTRLMLLPINLPAELLKYTLIAFKFISQVVDAYFNANLHQAN